VSVRPKPRSTRLLLVALVSLSLAVITVDYREGNDGPLAGLGRSALALMAPLQQAVTDVTRPVGNFLASIGHLPSLAQENRRLRDQIAADQVGVGHATSLENDVRQLQDLLGLQGSFDYPLKSATVIGNGVSNFESIITIDQGGDDGIAVDMPVVTADEFGAQLVGRVISTTPFSAQVLLITDRDSEVAARLVSTRQGGLLVGQGEGDMTMSFLRKDVVAEPGEVLETNGYQGGLYPSGITIGEVSRFVPATSVLDPYITVRPAVDFSTLDYVAVIQKPTDTVDTGTPSGG
jgi:rod shape-determining protein MreC